MLADLQLSLPSTRTERQNTLRGGTEHTLLAGHPETAGVQFSYRPEEEIYGEDEPAEFIYKVVSGAVRTHKLLADGRRQIGAFHLPGDLFGLEAAGQHQLTAEAVVETKVVLLKRRTLESLAARDVHVAYALWTAAVDNLRCAESRMLLLGRKTALERVATFLVEMDDRGGKHGAIDLPMSRRDVADYLGLTLETVSRAISQLRAGGLLRLVGARHVELKREKLCEAMEG
ncbi:MAG: helix-turn-helix domain-containing protein [Beijerinckiaceae bacterium]